MELEKLEKDIKAAQDAADDINRKIGEAKIVKEQLEEVVGPLMKSQEDTEEKENEVEDD